ncbi:hypothetical protein [Paenibacillus larvae]|uniref:hypothetical protein n=1 Tax=Paenibacillus larvae TaxID=1464 RepID=UPI00288ED320|nr:hypothetical protein [Paenibacillus larvae]MDT2193387.1 hypothetical protein [Paenibacillus larvae]
MFRRSLSVRWYGTAKRSCRSLSMYFIRDGNAAMAKLALQINGMLTDRIEVETTGPDKVDVEALNQRLFAFKDRRTQSGD